MVTRKTREELDTEMGKELPAGQEQPEPEEPSPGAPLDPALAGRLKTVIESLLFASAEPISFKRLLSVVREFHPGLSSQTLRYLVEMLRDDLREHGRGVRVAEVADAFQLRTPSESSPYIKKLVTTRPPRLTRATLETLAIVAYRQPVTRPEIEDIRGVDCGAVLKHLLERRLVRILGRKDEPGRPLLYATTPQFLEFFSLKDLKSLPTLKDFVELSDEHRAQLGLEEMEDVQERAGDAVAIAGRLVVEGGDAFAPVGQDEVIGELAEALEDVRRRDRELRKSGIIPVPHPTADQSGQGEGDG